jgi:hypothetical protein
MPQDESWSSSATSIQSLSNLPPFTFSQPEYSPSSFEPGPQHPLAGNHGPVNDSISTPGSGYPLSNALLLGPPGGYSHTSPMNRHDPPIIHPSRNFEPQAGLLGEPAHSFMGDARNDGPESSIAAINRTPWDGLHQEPKTSINGGTFIGGNLNNIQRHGEAGECPMFVSNTIHNESFERSAYLVSCCSRRRDP